ncbi:transaldolase [Ectocarpus siliculosus]|uniref:Transaldolase n=1 Tax=Ectocarpus siliculosus TaxID=2880 RepID=D7FVZ8_ECTSI|nr:transaldolase [Ectocarpus siliculosus]|eukprot:CBJ25518.1 transaldolase [Ectocarpus siliculosus]
MAEPTTKKQKVLTQYEQLAEVTKIVADTGEIAQIKKFAPTDATTNPSLLYKASSAPEHQDLVNDALAYGKALKDVTDDERVAKTMDKLSVNFGVEILTLVKGYVSTEVDARLSFDTEATLARARNIISLYEAAGVDKSRILIKIASTWEGIKACEVLQKEGITCNMTLLFALPQAAACAEAGATLISPFVGRILDYHKKKTGNSYPDAWQDPGCISVSEIYGYYKKHGYGTIVMGASFRSKDEVLQLAGCDRLTIAPKFLAELQESNGEVVQHLEASASAAACTLDKLPSSESAFRLAMNDDPMATSKLAEGIRGFSADLVKLEATVRDRLGVTPSPTPGPAWAPPAAAAAAANGDGVTNGNGNGGGGDKTEFDQLAEVTTIVADSGEIEAIRKYKPTDATTNPSLIYAAAQMPAYQGFVDDAVKHALGLQGSPKERVEAAMDKLSVNFGLEILKIVPGYVSTEVDARLSYDTEATVAKGRSIVALYKAAGIDKSRVLIKIASTWEGIRACEILQKEGISCNMTLLFCMAQAVACAEAGATLISPFVGRITDWYKADTGRSGYAAEEDPGCLSVSEIFGYYKKHGHGTIVMGASFRNKGQILQLAGCDRLTIAPKFLEELKSGTEKVERKLEPETASTAYSGGRYPADLKSFRLKLNENAMATEKLAEGIASFSQAIVKVEKIITDKIAAAST